MIIKGAEALFVVDNDPKHFLYVANIKRRGLHMCVNIYLNKVIHPQNR